MSPSPSRDLNVVQIVRLRTRPGVVAVTVRVDAPPSAGTQYLLLARFNGQYQVKGDVSASIGSHVIDADVRRADPGTWREFLVAGVAPAARREWDASLEEPLLALPDGTNVLTEPAAHRMPG